MDIEKIPFNKLLGIKKFSDSSVAQVEIPASIDYSNHLNTVHASAQFALGEAASGEFLFQHFKEYVAEKSIVPVIRNSNVKFRKPATGAIKARAYIDQEFADKAVERFETKGRVVIPVSVEVVDSEENLTMTATYDWFVSRI